MGPAAEYSSLITMAPTDKQASDSAEKSAIRPEAPPRPVRRKLKIVIALAVALLVLTVVAVYYFLFVAPYEDTDDSFIDGYVTLISPRVSGPVVKLLITDN
jgi:membrane fusion protein, multidrug efflux system